MKDSCSIGKTSSLITSSWYQKISEEVLSRSDINDREKSFLIIILRLERWRDIYLYVLDDINNLIVNAERVFDLGISEIEDSEWEEVIDQFSPEERSLICYLMIGNDVWKSANRWISNLEEIPEGISIPFIKIENVSLLTRDTKKTLENKKENESLNDLRIFKITALFIFSNFLEDFFEMVFPKGSQEMIGLATLLEKVKNTIPDIFSDLSQIISRVKNYKEQKFLCKLPVSSTLRRIRVNEQFIFNQDTCFNNSRFLIDRIYDNRFEGFLFPKYLYLSTCSIRNLVYLKEDNFLLKKISVVNSQSPSKEIRNYEDSFLQTTTLFHSLIEQLIWKERSDEEKREISALFYYTIERSELRFKILTSNDHDLLTIPDLVELLLQTNKHSANKFLKEIKSFLLTDEIQRMIYIEENKSLTTLIDDYLFSVRPERFVTITCQFENQQFSNFRKVEGINHAYASSLYWTDNFSKLFLPEQEHDKWLLAVLKRISKICYSDYSLKKFIAIEFVYCYNKIRIENFLTKQAEQFTGYNDVSQTFQERADDLLKTLLKKISKRIKFLLDVSYQASGVWKADEKEVVLSSKQILSKIKFFEFLNFDKEQKPEEFFKMFEENCLLISYFENELSN